MFEFSLSVRVSFWLVGASRMPRRCAATVPFFGKRHPHDRLPFLSSWKLRRGGRARSDTYVSWLIGVKNVAWTIVSITHMGSSSVQNVASSVVVCVVSWPSMVLTFIGGVEIGDRMDGSGDWGLYSSSAPITTRVANTLNGLGGKLRSLRLGGTIGCWLPNPYGIVGSLES